MQKKIPPSDILYPGDKYGRGSPKQPPSKQEIQAKREEQVQVDHERTNAIKHHREIIEQRKKNIAQGKVSQTTVKSEKSNELFYDPFLKDKSPYSRTKIPEPLARAETVVNSANKNEKDSVKNSKTEIQEDAKSNKTGKMQRSSQKPEIQVQKQKMETKTQRFSKSPQIIDEIFKPAIDRSVYKLNRNAPSPKPVQQTPSQKNVASSSSIPAQSAKKQTVEKYTTPKKVQPKKPTEIKSQQQKIAPKVEVSSTKKFDQQTPQQSDKKEIFVKPATNPYQMNRRPYPANSPSNISETRQSQVSIGSNASAKSDKKIQQKTPVKPTNIVKVNTLANSKSQAVVIVEKNPSKPPTSTQKFTKNVIQNDKKQDNTSNNTNQNKNIKKEPIDKKLSSPKTQLDQQSAKKNIYNRDKNNTNQNKQIALDAKANIKKNQDEQSINQLKKRVEELMKQNQIYVSQTTKLKSQLDKEKKAKDSKINNKEIISDKKDNEIKVQGYQNDILKRYFELQDAYQASRMELQLAKNDVIRKKAMFEIANLQIIQRNRLIMELRYDQQAKTPMMVEKLSQWTLQEGLHSYSRDPVGQIIKQRRKKHKQDCVNFRANVIQEMGKASRMSFQSPSLKRQKQMNGFNFRSQKLLKISRRDLFNSGQRTVMNSGQRYLEQENIAESSGKLQKLQLRLKLLKRQNDYLKHKVKHIEE